MSGTDFNESPLIEHLIELRARLVRGLLGLGVARWLYNVRENGSSASSTTPRPISARTRRARSSIRCSISGLSLDSLALIAAAPPAWRACFRQRA